MRELEGRDREATATNPSGTWLPSSKAHLCGPPLGLIRSAYAVLQLSMCPPGQCSAETKDMVVCVGEVPLYGGKVSVSLPKT